MKFAFVLLKCPIQREVQRAYLGIILVNPIFANLKSSVPALSLMIRFLLSILFSSKESPGSIGHPASEREAIGDNRCRQKKRTAAERQ